MNVMPLFAVASLVALSQFGNAAIFVYGGILAGPNESPPNASPATGSATVTVDTVLNTMRVEVQFSGLLGVTTACHIHAATAVPLTGTAGVATTTPTFTGFPLGVTAGTYDNTLDMTLATSYNASYVTANGGTTASAWAALQSAIANGQSYINVHSSVFGGGEIRDFLRPVPEPASLAALGMGALALIRRRRVRR